MDVKISVTVSLPAGTGAEAAVGVEILGEMLSAISEDFDVVSTTVSVKE